MKLSKIAQTFVLAGLTLAASVNAEMVLRRGNGAEPQSIDPQISEGVPASNILRDLFEGLVAEDKDGKNVPGVAKSWEISEDGLTYTFHLRDTTWTNGDPVTAGDFVYAWQRGVNPATGTNYAFLLYPIANAEAISKGEEKDLSKLGAKAIDDKTLEVKLSGPTPYFLGMLNHSVAYPVPKKVVEKLGKEWTRAENVVSNGPFKMSKWVPQASIELVKSDTYWDKDVVKLDKVIFYPTENQNAELKRFRAGELDWTNEIPLDQLKFIKKEMPDQFKVANYLGTYYYGLNTSKAPFKDNLPLRKALTLAINREVLVNKVTGAGETPAYGFVVPGVQGAIPYLPAEAKLTQKERLEMAKKLYNEAGYSKDKPLEVELRYNTSENHKKVAIAVAAMWKQSLGIKVNLVNEEWKVYLQTRKQKNTQVFRAGWIGDYNDPNTFLDLFLSGSGLNDVSFNSPEFDKLMAEAAQETDADKRAQLLNTAEKIFVDSYSLIPIYHYVTKRMVSPKLKGYTINVMDHSRSKYMYIEE
ncbi:MAG: peptide ABC transporter substrate-binding protein [Gammaproteobacteria bacterium]|nr:peptide ABC transporter substrate-binding protein [Gammaproteobacteria bacterium]